MLINKTRIEHLARNINQRLFKSTIGVVGGYHGSNLGDMALGASVVDVLKAKGISSGLQTIYNLDKWPKTPYAIVGGGAVGYSDSLTRVARRYKGQYEKVALLGVDFMEKSYPAECIELIKGAAYVSGRSKFQADRLKELTGREQIYNHPDIAFSLLNDYCEAARTQEKPDSKTLMINLVPLYAQMKDGQYFPVEQYRSERPELYEKFDTMHKSYHKVVRAVTDEALQKGYKVQSIPFTPLDGEYTKLVLKGLPVEHLPYNSDPYQMLKKITTASWVIATRFHTTIFALKAGVKITPIAYATKNELLLNELGVERSSFLSTLDLANGLDEPKAPFVIANDKIKATEQESLNAIRHCVESLYEGSR